MSLSFSTKKFTYFLCLVSIRSTQFQKENKEIFYSFVKGRGKGEGLEGRAVEGGKRKAPQTKFVQMPRDTSEFMGSMLVLFQWLRRVDSATVASNGTVRVGDERYIMLTGVLVATHDDTYMSRLTIHNATERHTGLYMCSVTPTDTAASNHLAAFLQVLTPS